MFGRILLARQFRLGLLAAAALSLGLTACGEPENPASEATTTMPETTANGAATDTAGVDAETTNYVEKAAVSDMYEIESSRLALERSTVQPVKDFAQMMIDAHTATSTEMSGLVSGAGIMPPTALDNDHMGKMDQLREASAEDFDDRYIDQQTAAHEAALDLHRDYADGGQNAALQAFAAKTAPAVEQHLQQVKALDDSPADDKADDAPSN
jgi:putative membrane protein